MNVGDLLEGESIGRLHWGLLLYNADIKFQSYFTIYQVRQVARAAPMTDSIASARFF